MKKRDPTDAERQVARESYVRGTKVLFADDFKCQAAFEKNWVVSMDNRSNRRANRIPRSPSILGKGVAVDTIDTDHGFAIWSTREIISKQAFQYGLFEARMDIAGATEIDNTFRLTSQNDLSCGACDLFEILIAEACYPDQIDPTQPRLNSNTSVDRYETGNNIPATENLAAGFHDYGVLWTPDALVFCVDGNAIRTIETKGAVVGAMNLHLSTVPGGFAGEPPDDQRGWMTPVASVRVLEL